jgi:hypothetical protein
MASEADLEPRCLDSEPSALLHAMGLSPTHSQLYSRPFSPSVLGFVFLAKLGFDNSVDSVEIH